MKISKEIKNGFLIFIGIAIYFLIMDFTGLSKYFILRLFNIIIVTYGLNQTIKSNLNEGKVGYIQNLISSGLTGFIGVIFSVAALALYINFKGGTPYIHNLSEIFLFGGKPNIPEYCFGILLEGIASVLVVVFINMQFWSTKNVFKS